MCVEVIRSLPRGTGYVTSLPPPKKIKPQVRMARLLFKGLRSGPAEGQRLAERNQPGSSGTKPSPKKTGGPIRGRKAPAPSRPGRRWRSRAVVGGLAPAGEVRRRTAAARLAELRLLTHGPGRCPSPLGQGIRRVGGADSG